MKPATLTVTVTPRDGPPVNLICLPVPAEPVLPPGGGIDMVAELLAYCVCSRTDEPFVGREYADTLAEAVALWVELGTRRYDLWALARVVEPAHDVETRWHRGAGTWEPWRQVAELAPGVRIDPGENVTAEAVAVCLVNCADLMAEAVQRIDAEEYSTNRESPLLTEQASTARGLAAAIRAAKEVRR